MVALLKRHQYGNENFDGSGCYGRRHKADIFSLTGLQDGLVL
jgi:hypothetical protein